MNALKISPHPKTNPSASHGFKDGLGALLAIFLACEVTLPSGWAQQPENDVPGAQVLTRGPVHEAFAGIVTFNPEPGVVATKAPPDVIEEMPPEERPEGDNVAWIPGYWGWDDERSDYLWVSGTWRALPPGREWMAGYWGKTTHGHQWISGYWADAAARETTYLPPPPATIEVGPNVAAPSIDYGWTPGCWVWYEGRYAWRPGYWVQGRADWSWSPAHYVWTPRGYIFVGGFWDYPVQRRGVLFAPVYFESGVYSRRGYRYSPSIVINLDVFSAHLFLRPSYHHYYFGDYYAPSYVQGGFYASFSFQSSRHGYDPIYSHQHWEHRRDRDWGRRVETSYQYRRENETARPPRTWAAQVTINQTTVNQTTINQTTINQGKSESQPTRVVMATPFAQLAKRTDSPMRFQPVAKAEREKLAVRGQEVQHSRDQRRTLEDKPVDTAPRKPGVAFEPAKVQLPRSPIVAKPVSQLGRDQAPPKAPQAPKPDPKFQPKAEPASRPPKEGRSDPKSEPRKPEPEKKPAPKRGETKSSERPVQPESQPRAKETTVKAQEESQRAAKELEMRAQQVSERRTKEAAAKAQEEAQRNAKGLEKKTQQETEQRAKDSAVKAREETQRNAKGLEKKTQQEAEQRAKDSAVKAREEAQRNAKGLEKKTPTTSEPTTKKKPAPSEKGATKPMKKDTKKKGEEPQPPQEKPPISP